MKPEYPSSPNDQPEEHPTSQDGEAPADGFDDEGMVESPLPQSLLMALAHSESRMYMSPLPAPADLERMERILPGAFERLLTMAEQDAKTTRENETKVVDSSIADRNVARKVSTRGQIFGLVVAVLGLLLSGIAIFLGHPVAATLLGFTPLATLVGVFVVGKNQKNEAPGDDDTADG